MITKLCLIIGIVPLLILYGVKIYENKMWLTFPLAIACMLAVVVGIMIFFVHIGWVPK